MPLDEDDKSNKEEKINQSIALWTKNKVKSKKKNTKTSILILINYDKP